MSAYRKRPVVVTARRWWKHGDHEHVRHFRRPEPRYAGTMTHATCLRTWDEHGWIDTLEGGHNVCPGDWIITGIAGEHYPCKPDVFDATYELVTP